MNPFFPSPTNFNQLTSSFWYKNNHAIHRPSLYTFHRCIRSSSTHRYNRYVPVIIRLPTYPPNPTQTLNLSKSFEEVNASRAKAVRPHSPTWRSTISRDPLTTTVIQEKIPPSTGPREDYQVQVLQFRLVNFRILLKLRAEKRKERNGTLMLYL